MKSTIAVLVAILVMSSFPCDLHAQSTLTLNTADSSPYSRPDNSGFYDVLLSQVFDKIGVKISINHLPSKRSIFNANAGIDDGEYARVKGIEDSYENLVIVDEKLINFGFTVFSKDQSIKVSDWEDLKGYNIAYINGWKIYESNAMSYKSLIIANNVKELFNLLVNDRVDLILYEKWRGVDYIKETGLSGIYPAPEPLATKGMYLYLNKKNSALVQDIKSAIQTLKYDGQYDKLIKAILEN